MHLPAETPPEQSTNPPVDSRRAPEPHEPMNTQRLLPIASLAFAVLMAVLYLAAMREEAAPEPEPTPVAVAAATPSPRAKKPPPRRPSHPLPVLPEAPTRPERPEPVETDTEMTLSGRVVLSSGATASKASVVTFLNGRRRVARTDGSGDFSLTLPGGKARIRAERMDGPLLQHSEWVSFDGTEGGTWEVDLVLPEARRGGLGVTIGKHADGIRIKSVLPGSPAEELGLATGDLVLEVGGIPANELGLSDFASQMTGDVGTSQSFFVRRRDGTEAELSFERQAIER